VENFREIIPSGPKVIRRNTLNFAQNFSVFSPNFWTNCQSCTCIPSFGKVSRRSARELGDLWPQFKKAVAKKIFDGTLPNVVSVTYIV